MSAIKLSTPSSGSISLSPADTASNLTITVPAVTGTMNVQGSTFKARKTLSDQSVTSNTWTKITYDTVVFDTNSNFSSSRFTPTFAGYYSVSVILYGTGTSVTNTGAAIYKNGEREDAISGPTTANNLVECTSLVYLNGSTDYIEAYGRVTATTPAFAAEGTTTSNSFSAVLVRGA